MPFHLPLSILYIYQNKEQILKYYGNIFVFFWEPHVKTTFCEDDLK